MIRIYLVSILLISLASGCTKKQSETSEHNPVAAKDEMAASPSASGHKAYDIVLEQVPDSIPEYFKIVKTSYDICVNDGQTCEEFP